MSELPDLWRHLPNAKHIDAVIASAKEHPVVWIRAWKFALPGIDLRAASDIILNKDLWYAYDSGFECLLNGQDNGQDVRKLIKAASWALVALIAYDDCAYMLESDPIDIEMLARLGDYKAAILLPACKAFATIRSVVDCD